jgi:hypothetical protein
MKAILRWGLGLVGLLLVSAVAHGYYWVTPVTKCPYPQAPSICNSGFYMMDAYGRWSGPHYYVYPPMQPHQGPLPGPVGQAIMAGNLPHTLLMKEGANMGGFPMLPSNRHGLFNFGGHQQGNGPPPPNGPDMSHMAGSARPMGPMQTPYGMPTQSAGMPYGQMPMQAAYPGQTPGQYMSHHGSHKSPFAPIPGFTPQAPMMPMQPMTPAMPQYVPQYPGMPPMPQYGPLQPGMPPMAPMAPMPNMTPMQMPRMDMVPPPGPPRVGGNAFPTHPFIRSPRDFFMWGENMEDEARMRNRPFPVPR